MPEFQILPSPRVNPYAGDNVRAFKTIMDILGQAEVARRRKIVRDNVLQAIASGNGAEGISSAAMMKPGFSEGLPGILQRIASPYAEMTPGIEDIIAGKGIETAMRDPLETAALRADIAYKMARAENPRMGTLPGWWSIATDEQKQNYLNNVGKPLTINMGGFSTTEKKTLGSEMDNRIDSAKKGFWGRTFGANYNEDNLFREWQNFISTNTFDNENQKMNAWNAWRLKVEKLGIDWNPEDPKWKEAIGLPVEEKQTETQTATKQQPKANYYGEGIPFNTMKEPATPEEFEANRNKIKDRAGRMTYYKKWKHLWPDLYE